MRLLKNNNPAHTLTKEEARKGGLKSGETRRARKTFREELINLLSMDDNNLKVSMAILQKALEGDITAFNSLRDTIGEKPVDKVESETTTKIKVDVSDE